MPKSNFCQPKTDERLDFLREAVDGGMSRNKIKVKELSVKTGINKSTLYKRRQKPETMTIGELLPLSLMMVCHAPLSVDQGTIRT